MIVLVQISDNFIVNSLHYYFNRFSTKNAPNIITTVANLLMLTSECMYVH